MILEGAACTGQDDIMFDPNRETEALALCAGCPAIDPCREAVEAEPFLWDGYGVWAGLTVRERNAPTVTVDCGFCGVTFSYQHLAGRPRKFCSKQCIRAADLERLRNDNRKKVSAA